MKHSFYSMTDLKILFNEFLCSILAQSFGYMNIYFIPRVQWHEWEGGLTLRTTTRLSTHGLWRLSGMNVIYIYIILFFYWNRRQSLCMQLVPPYVFVFSCVPYSFRWVFKQLYDKGLVYRGVKVMPFSTACNTPLSNFESNQNYKVGPTTITPRAL